MEKFRSEFIWLCLCFVITSQNPAERENSRGRDSNLMTIIQQIQLQLNSLESEGNRQSSRIQEVLTATTRLEVQRQEFIGILDRSDSQLSQKLEDTKADVRKILTLQDILREDVEKIQQNQLLAKVRMEEYFQHRQSLSAKSDASSDSNSASVNPDITNNLQILQTSLQGLRRMADTLQSTINLVKLNLTDLANITRLMAKYERESLVTKSYLQTSLIALTSEKTDSVPLPVKDSDEKLPTDCMEVQRDLKNQSGVYRIQLQHARRPIFVFCDMVTDGGGWTVIQRRMDGAIDFLREWQDYKHGFGNVRGEFWFGNENLYLMTHQDLQELRIDLEDFDGGKGYALYDAFAIGSEKEKYNLKLLGSLKTGDIGDGMTYHASIPFSTIDMDNDRWEGGNCAVDHTGGWWYNQCDASNLNGKYLNGVNPHEFQGVYWREWHGPSYSLMGTKMMIRPVEAKMPKPIEDDLLNFSF